MRAMLEAAAYLTERRRVEYIFFDGRTFSTRAQIEEVLSAAAASGCTLAHPAPDMCRCGCRRAPGRATTLAIRRRIAIRPFIARSSSVLSQFLHAKLEVDTTLGIDGQLAAVEAYLKGEE